MEWDFKDFACWDSSDELDQLEKKEESDLAALVGSSISKGQRYNNRSAGSLPLVVDLKLGNGPLNKLQEDQMKLSAALVSSSSSSPKSSSVRRVVHNNGSDQRQKVSCLVDGCKADLRRCREYHRRHRVCELHSKTPVVIVRGEQKRFCQQCSRFHSLVEFDEVKRSCRKRLNGHNQRRRKPKPESLYFSSNSFFSNYKGPRILQFSNPQLCATTNVRSVWPVEAKKGSEPTLYNRHQWWHAKDQRSPPPNSFKGEEKPFLILQKNDPKAAAAAATNRAAPQAFVCHQPFPTTAASPDSRKLGGRIMSSDGITRGIDSGCALYLLSSQPTQNSVAGLNQHSVQSSATTRPGQLLDSRLQTNGFSDFSCSHDVEDKPVNPEMMFLLGPDGFYDNGAQMLPILLE